MALFRFLTIDPVNLTLKAKAYSIIACFCSIFFVALISRIVEPGPEFPIIVASMGASAVILFFIPNSPLAQPWPFMGGQLCSAVVGITCALHINETASASAVALGSAVLIMIILRCLHPPAAATSLAPIMAGHSITSLGYDFVIQPVAINVCFMMFLAIFINRWVLKLNYPSPFPVKNTLQEESNKLNEPSLNIGISEADLEKALTDLDVFVDMTHSDLSKIITLSEMNTFKRIRGDLCCADIMMKDVMSVEFGTEVEDAWQMMYTHNLKAVPVIDKSRRIIGIITWHDFFKNIDLNVYDGLQHTFRNFIRRTAKVSASKPEAVGQIMSAHVVVLPGDAHIVELIPLMSFHGHRQIPIVNTEKRLLGMVYQANLIAAIYNTSLAHNVY